MRAISVPILVCAFLISGASASAKDNGTVPIRFVPGRLCWRYEGNASAFVGTFVKGQKLLITATGDAHFGEGRTEWIQTEAREVDLDSSGDNDIAVNANKDGLFTIPRIGQYDLTLWPHAIQGYRGTTIVCKR